MDTCAFYLAIKTLEQITPAIRTLLVVIPESQQRPATENLISLISSNQNSVLENSRICACYILKSYPKVPSEMALSLTSIATEGAKNNFLSKATHPRAFFTDLRCEIISFITDFSLADDDFHKNLIEQDKLVKTLILCLDDYTRNHKGDIGSTVRIAAMQNIQKLEKFYKYLPPATQTLLIGKILQQGAEKILRIREEAGKEMVFISSILQGGLSIWISIGVLICSSIDVPICSEIRKFSAFMR